jgi:Holliday junction resolvase RusA-like endonuclease
MAVFGIVTALPPSVNDLYVRTPWGMAYSKATKQFMTAAKVELIKQWMFEEKLDPNAPHWLALIFYLPKVQNLGWPDKAKTRYKRVDVSNYVKILEDVIASVLGVDDSSTMQMLLFKEESPENPRVEIFLGDCPE